MQHDAIIGPALFTSSTSNVSGKARQ